MQMVRHLHLALALALQLYPPLPPVLALAADARHTLPLKERYALIDRGDPKEVAGVISWQGRRGSSGQGEQLWAGQHLKLLKPQVGEPARHDITGLKSGLKAPNAELIADPKLLAREPHTPLIYAGLHPVEHLNG